MGDQTHQEHFLNATLRHFAALRSPGLDPADCGTSFPKTWFDLPQKTLADLGTMMFLLSLTKYHRPRNLGDVFDGLEPALRLGQYKIFYSGDYPRAFITWAGLSPEIEYRFAVSHMSLRPQDWNSGASPWLIEFAAPFGHLDQIVPMLSQNPDLTHVRALWHNKTGKRYRIVEWGRPRGEEEVKVRSYGVSQFEKHLSGAE